MNIFGYDLTTVEHLFQIIITGAAAFGILYKVTYWISDKLKKEYEKIVKVHDMIEFICSELKPNHGSSLTDKINRIESDVKENTYLTKQICNRQRWILNSKQELIFECDKKGNCTWVSEEYCRLMNVPLKDFFNNGWKNIIHEDDRERVTSEWQLAVKEKRNSRISYRIVSKDGDVYEVESTATISDEFGYIGKIDIIKKVE